MAKLHINHETNLNDATFCGRFSTGAMAFIEFEQDYDADNIPAETCGRCLDSATTRLTHKRQFEAAREMDAAREAVAGSLYAWQDAAAGSDTPKARKAQAMATAMLAILDAGMQNGGARAF